MAAIFRSRQTFLPDVIPEVEYTSKISMRISDMLGIWSVLQLTYWWEYINFNKWLTLWPGGVINDVINTHLWKFSHNLMIPMHSKFNDDIFALF